MIDQRALDFHRPDAVTRHVEDVVNATQQPEVTVFVALGAVAGEIDVAPPPVPILFYVAIHVAVDAPQHSGPWLREGEEAAPHIDRCPIVATNLGRDARERAGGRSRLGSSDAGERRDHDVPGFGLPPRIDDWTPLAA